MKSVLTSIVDNNAYETRNLRTCNHNINLKCYCYKVTMTNTTENNKLDSEDTPTTHGGYTGRVPLKWKYGLIKREEDPVEVINDSDNEGKGETLLDKSQGWREASLTMIIVK